MSTPLHVYYSAYPNNVIQKIQAHITSQGQTIVHVNKIINSFMTITMIGRYFDQKKKENIIRFILHIQASSTKLTSMSMVCPIVYL